LITAVGLDHRQNPTITNGCDAKMASLPVLRRFRRLIRAADLLGVNRNTLPKKIRDLDIRVVRSSTWDF
jgi:hypothetical protein